MSTVVERIGRYAADLRFAELDAPVVDYAKRILLDSLACAYGGLDSDPARIVRITVQEELNGGEQATVFGKGTKLSAPLAALTNGVALRYQDYNDVYFGPAWTAHPSDNLATLLAAAEWCDRSGREFLRAMVTAYEVQMRFADLPVARNLWHAGWHHTGACAYSAAAGAGALLGLDAAQLGHAIALSGARSNTLSEIRHGDIPMDKALSAPLVASQSILYALLARRGFTGCSTLLEGPYGFGRAVAGGVDVASLVPQRGDFLEEKPELTALFGQRLRPAAVEVKTPRGAFHREVRCPLGDPRNPMSWDDVTKKFVAQAEPVLGMTLTRDIIERTFSIEKEENMHAFAEMLGGKRKPQ